MIFVADAASFGIIAYYTAKGGHVIGGWLAKDMGRVMRMLKR